MNGLSRGQAAVSLTQADDPPMDEQVGHLLWCAERRASAIFCSEIGDESMTTTQFVVMAKLYDLGQLSKNHLGQLAALDPATTQAVIKRLCAIGLVERLPDNHDRRRIILQLTEAGNKVVEKVRAQMAKTNELILGPLSPSDRSQFLGLLKRLV